MRWKSPTSSHPGNVKIIHIILSWWKLYLSSHLCEVKIIHTLSSLWGGNNPHLWKVKLIPILSSLWCENYLYDLISGRWKSSLWSHPLLCEVNIIHILGEVKIIHNILLKPSTSSHLCKVKTIHIFLSGERLRSFTSSYLCEVKIIHILEMWNSFLSSYLCEMKIIHILSFGGKVKIIHIILSLWCDQNTHFRNVKVIPILQSS